MSIKRKVTSIAVDSARDYLRERLNELKQLDLDKDGQKDVDQMAALLTGLSEKVKDCLDSTDFKKLASGLEQIVSGVGLVGASIDPQKLGAASGELTAGLSQLGKLLQLGIQEVKSEGKLPD